MIRIKNKVNYSKKPSLNKKVKRKSPISKSVNSNKNISNSHWGGTDYTKADIDRLNIIINAQNPSKEIPSKEIRDIQREIIYKKQEGNYKDVTKLLAKLNELKATSAEKKFRDFILKLNIRPPDGNVSFQYTFSKNWILDFFFHHVRLGIEIDGSYHNREDQKEKDILKNEACKTYDITLLRLTNKEVFSISDSNMKILLRDAWKAAKNKNRTLIKYNKE